ncbi:FKBP-type peptidyl-prolyl cis-trans isomerase, partial [Providencia rustigianii]
SLGQTSDKQVKTLTDKNQQLALQLASQVAQLSEKSNLETELAIAKKQQVEQKNNQERLTKQLTDSQNQQDLLQTQLAANEKSYIDTQSQLKQANSQVQKLQKDLEKQTALVGKASDKQIKDLTSDLSKQISLLEQREAELVKLGADKQGIKDALTAQLSDKKKLESQNSKLVAQAKDQEKQISQLETDLANRNKQQSDIEQRLLDANKQLNELKLEAQKFTAENTGKQNQELDKLKKQLDDKVLADTKVQKELTKAKESLKKAEDELVSLKSFSTDDGLKSQIRDLNQRVMQLRKENDSLKSAQTHQAQSSGKTPSIIKIPAKDTNSVAQENAKRNQKIIQDINQQKYSKLDSHTYYKVLQKGAPISNVADKQITIIMREQLTDGKVTVMHTEQNPMVLAYNQLPPPLNMFVDKIGVGGMVKVYIEPEGGYGVDGVPGTIPPNSMSIIDFKVISAK